MDRHYPRTYKVDRRARQFVVGLGTLLIVCSVAMTALHLSGVMPHPLPLYSLLLGDFALLMVFMAVIHEASRRVILEQDSIEVAGWFASRKLRRPEILGYKLGQLPKRAGGGYYYIIVPTDRRDFKLPPFLHVDDHFLLWIKSLPYLKQ